MQTRPFRIFVLAASIFSFFIYTTEAQVGNDSPVTPNSAFLENIFIDSDDISIATNQFKQAVPKLFRETERNRQILNRLFVDVIDIINENEYNLWLQLTSNVERMQFISSFWKRRDPTLSTLTNERLYEHYQRLLIARKSYSNHSDRTYDHRGTIFVRYGEPDEVYNETQVATSIARTHSQIFGENFRPAVATWFYHAFKPAVVFDFFEGPDGYVLFNQIDFGLQTLEGLDRQKAYVEIVKQRKLVSPAYQSADFEYRTLKRFGNWSQEDGFRNMAFLVNTEAFKMQKKREKLDHVVSRILSDLPFVQEILSFENENSTTYIVNFGLEQKAVAYSAEYPVQSVLMNTLITDSRKVKVSNRNAVIPIEYTEEKSETIHGAFDFELRNDDYLIHSEAINNQGNQHGKQEILLNKEKKKNQELTLSSVLLAENILPEADSLSIPSYQRIMRSSLAIEPTPFRKFSLTDPVFVYFEIYGLRQDESGTTDFQIEYKMKEKKKGGIAGFFKKSGMSTTISNRQSGSTSTDIAYSQLDLGKIGSGDYELTVHVRDHIAKKSKDAKVSFHIE